MMNTLKFKKKSLVAGVITGLMTQGAYAIVSAPVGPFTGRQITSTAHDVIGAVTIGSALSLDTANLSQHDDDEDVVGSGMWLYQWQQTDGNSGWQDIGQPGLTGSVNDITFTVKPENAGKYLRVCLSAVGNERSFPANTKYSTVKCDIAGTPGTIGLPGGGIPRIDIADGVPTFGGDGDKTVDIPDAVKGEAEIQRPDLVIDTVADATVNENDAYSVQLKADLSGGGKGAGQFTWSLVEGPDNAHFTMDASGNLKMAAQSFEQPKDDGVDNIYSVTVKAVDSVTKAESTTDVKVKVLDVADLRISFAEPDTDTDTDAEADNLDTYTDVVVSDKVPGGADGAYQSLENKEVTLVAPSGVTGFSILDNLITKTNDKGTASWAVKASVAGSYNISALINDAGQEVKADSTLTFKVADKIENNLSDGAAAVQIVDGDGARLTGELPVGTVLNSKVILQGETNENATRNRDKTPSDTPLAYQWMVEEAPGSQKFVPINGATATTYTVTGAEQGRAIQLDANVGRTE